MAGTNYHLMERDETKKEEWHDKYAQLTWQAWNGLERLIGTAVAPASVTEPEDPVLVLKREWEARYKALDEQRDTGDDSDEARQPFYDRLDETEVQVLRTQAATSAGIAVKLILWARLHCTADEVSGLTWNHKSIQGRPFDLGRQPVMSALLDLERMSQGVVPSTIKEPVIDEALFDALAEYNRLAVISHDLEHRSDILRLGTPEAADASEAFQTAYKKTMKAWETARDTPAATQAGLFAKLQGMVQFVDELSIDELYEAEWNTIKADVRRIAGEGQS